MPAFPVTTWDSDAPTSKRIAFYGVDDLASGRILGEQAIKLLNGKGKVAIITSLGATNLQNRLERREGGAGEGAGHRDRRDLRHPGRHASAAPRSSPPDRAAIPISRRGFPSAAGRCSRRNALAGVDSSKTKVISFDTISPALDLLREGKVQVLLGQKYFGWGSESVKLLRDIKQGKNAGVADHRFGRRRRHEGERRRVRTAVEKDGGSIAMKISRSRNSSNSSPAARRGSCRRASLRRSNSPSLTPRGRCRSPRCG